MDRWVAPPRPSRKEPVGRLERRPRRRRRAVTLRSLRSPIAASFPGARSARSAWREAPSEAAARRDPEVVAIAKRRQFSGSEKRRLLAEAERCKEAGTLGAFLRGERIYSSMIASWRKQVGVADQTALGPKRRGPKPDASARQIQQLQRHNA